MENESYDEQNGRNFPNVWSRRYARLQGIFIFFVFLLKKIHIGRVYIQLTTLRKHAYSNILKISAPKNEDFQIKNSDIFHISAQNIDCGYSLEPPRRGGSNEYP